MTAAADAGPRHAAVWDALAGVLAAAGNGGLTVVDAGGGSGGFAVPLAERGHRVLVIDPSPDALAALASRARDRGVADRVSGRQGYLSELPALAGPDSADLLLCHSVLDRVDDPGAALAAAARVLRPGGWLSLLVAGRAGAVLARALTGRFDEAARLLTEPAGRAGPGEPARRFDTAEVVALAEAAGTEVVAVHGVRLFADLVAAWPPAGAVPPGGPASAAQPAVGAAPLAEPPPAAWAEQLARLDALAAARAPYRDLAGQLHVLARLPDHAPA